MDNITFSLFDLLLLIGITQGLITSVLLLRSKEKRLGKKILGYSLIAFSLINCRILLHTLGLWNVSYLRFFPLGFELFLPPLVYFYIVSLVDSEFKWTAKTTLHLLPAFLLFAYDLTLYLLALLQPTFAEKDAVSVAMHFNTVNIVEDVAILSSTLIYLGFGFYKLKGFLQWVKQFESYKTFALYRWIKVIFAWMSILGMVLLTNHILDLVVEPDEMRWRWRVFNLIVAFITYYLGFMGYKQDDKKLYDSKLNLDDISKKRSQSQELESRLKHLLEKDKLYLDPDLNSKQLADELGITVKDLSFVINQMFQQSFRELINLYRIKEVKSIFDASDEKPSSILNVALGCGFNSQASFYRAFKKIEGVTPKQYLAAKNQISLRN